MNAGRVLGQMHSYNCSATPEDWPWIRWPTKYICFTFRIWSIRALRCPLRNVISACHMLWFFHLCMAAGRLASGSRQQNQRHHYSQDATRCRDPPRHQISPPFWLLSLKLRIHHRCKRLPPPHEWIAWAVIVSNIESCRGDGLAL